MPEIDLNSLKKLYYSIKEVSNMFGVNPSLVRFWEKEFAIIQPKKSSRGNRLFTVKDIENFNKIYILVKEQGFTLEGAKKALKSKVSPTEIQHPQLNNNVEIIEKLEAIKLKLIGLKNH